MIILEPAGFVKLYRLTLTEGCKQRSGNLHPVNVVCETKMLILKLNFKNLFVIYEHKIGAD